MAAKKAAVTKVARKAKAPVDDGIYWVVSIREFLTWSPVFVHKTKAAADAQATKLETENPSVIQKYKVTRVTLVA